MRVSGIFSGLLTATAVAAESAYYQISQYTAADPSYTVSEFGQAVSAHGEFILVGSPDAVDSSGDRVGSVSIFNAYSVQDVETVSMGAVRLVYLFRTLHN